MDFILDARTVGDPHRGHGAESTAFARATAGPPQSIRSKGRGNIRGEGESLQPSRGCKPVGTTLSLMFRAVVGPDDPVQAEVTI